MSSTVANLPSGAPAADTDIVYTVKDPSGTPSDAKLALSDIKDYVLAGGGGGAVGPTGAVQFSDGAGALAYSSNIIVFDYGSGGQVLAVTENSSNTSKSATLYRNSTTHGLDVYWSNDGNYASDASIFASNQFSPSLYLYGSYPANSISGEVSIVIPEPASSAGNYSYTLTLPDSPGSSGQVLSTDGTGVLSWVNNAAGPAGAVQVSDGAGALDYSQYIIASDDGAGTQRLNVGDEAVVQFTGLFKVATGSGFFADFSDTDASGYHSYVDVYAPKAEFSPRISLEGIKADFPTEITGIVRIKIPEPATSAGNYFYTLTLPDSPGTSGQVLSTDGTGVLSWVDPAGGTAPATASSTGRAGEIRYDSSYVYVCVATNTWKRAALSTW